MFSLQSSNNQSTATCTKIRNPDADTALNACATLNTAITLADPSMPNAAPAKVSDSRRLGASAINNRFAPAKWTNWNVLAATYLLCSLVGIFACPVLYDRMYCDIHCLPYQTIPDHMEHYILLHGFIAVFEIPPCIFAIWCPIWTWRTLRRAHNERAQKRHESVRAGRCLRETSKQLAQAERIDRIGSWTIAILLVALLVHFPRLISDMRTQLWDIAHLYNLHQW